MRKLLPFILLSLFIGVSCTQEPADEPVSTVSFNATLSSMLKQQWKEGDKVSVISLKSGSAATIDTFTAQGDGSEASFSGIYSGAEDATLLVAYPALENTSGKAYDSAPIWGNAVGFFRSVLGNSYVLFAPQAGLRFLQEQNGSAGMENADFLLAEVKAKGLFAGEKPSLRSKLALIKLTLDASAVAKTEKARKVTLSLSQGTPFTARGSISLSGSATQWTASEANKSTSMELGEFAPGSTLNVFVPVYPRIGDATLSGASAVRYLTVDVSTDKQTYQAKVSIPAGSKAHDLVAGTRINISGTLTPSGEPPVEEPVIGEVKKLAEKGVSAVCMDTDGNSLYVGETGKITVWDTSLDPMSPTIAGTVDFPGNPRTMVAYNGRLYVAARESGVWVFNVQDPQHMSIITRYDGIELSTGIDAAGDCIFVGERQTGVEFVDARTITKPQHMQVIKTPESQTVFYQNGYLYSGEWSAGQVNIFDARDLSNVQLVSTIPLSGYGDGIWVYGKRLYASTGHNKRNPSSGSNDGEGHGVEVWDISNPADPRRLSRQEFDTFYMSGYDHWFPCPSGDCKTLFCGDVFNGMYVVDITTETSPKILAHWTPLRNTAEKKDAVLSMALGRGVAYVTVSNEGLFAIPSRLASPSPRNRGTSPTNLSYRHSYPTDANSHFYAWIPDQRGAVKGAAVYGDALFVGCGDAGLYTVKKDAQGKPYKVSRLDIPFAGGVAVYGDKLFVARGHAGLGVYRIGSNLSLTQIALLNTELSPDKPAYRFSYWVSVPNDNYVVNGCRSNGYEFLAMGGTSANPTFTWRRTYALNLNYNRYISEKTINNYLAYATRSGLVWINLSSKNEVPKPAPLEDSEFLNSLTEGVTHYKDGYFLLTRRHQLWLIKPNGGVNDIVAQTDWGTGWEHYSGEYWSGIPRWESGNTVLLSNFVNRYVTKIQTGDLVDYSATQKKLLATEAFHEETVGYPEPGLFWDGKCVVPCGFQGLLVEK